MCFFLQQCEATCAKSMKAHMPVSLMALLNSDDWKGGPILDLKESGGIKTATAKEISLNFPFIKPVVKFSPSKVQGFLKI